MHTITTDTSTVPSNHFNELEVTNLDYARAAAVRWEIGRKERGLSASDAFQGEAVSEAAEEVLDFGNYWRVAYEQGKIPLEVYRDGTKQAMDLWIATQTFGDG